MQDLRTKLEAIVASLPAEMQEQIRQQSSSSVSVYPFNPTESLLSNLLGMQAISLQQYYDLRAEYVARNRYLSIFEISAPRGFGETWAQGHLKELVSELTKPSPKLDAAFSGEYDFLLADESGEYIKIEVKASRAVDAGSRESLYMKALSSASDRPFDMNFQQIKPACCDVFVWVAVWKDLIRYWVLTTDEVKNHKDYNDLQHRGNSGEGQLHIKNTNIRDFDRFEVKAVELKQKILDAGRARKRAGVR